VSTEIEKYLGTVQESTAKTISSRLGMAQIDVAKELNHMHTDGVVERKKRHGGNEYLYWLARSDSSVRQKDGVVTVIAITNTGPGTSATAVLSGPMDVSSSVLEQVPGPFEKAAEDMLDLRLRLEDVSRERDAVRTEAESQKDLIAKLESHITSLQSQLVDARNDLAPLEAANTKLRENTTALERAIDDLTGVADAQLPKVYVTVGKYAKPKRHGDLPKAQRRAAALVRNEKESEVLVLAPVGRMVRGSEWKSQ